MEVTKTQYFKLKIIVDIILGCKRMITVKEVFFRGEEPQIV